MPTSHPIPLTLASHNQRMRTASLSPISNMSPQQPSRTASSDSDAIRKRVGKACDRCRLKKSKCDGTTPCGRCRADNAICAFGERKKSHDKVYPKGYVEMLEEHLAKTVEGLQELYARMNKLNAWEGPELAEESGRPLTHDILTAVNVLRPGDEEFLEDPQRMQKELYEQGATDANQNRKSSASSHSDQSHVGHGHNYSSQPSSPGNKRQRLSYHSSSHPSTLQNSPVQQHDPELAEPQWNQAATSQQADFSMVAPDYPPQQLQFQGQMMQDDFSDYAHMSGNQMGANQMNGIHMNGNQMNGIQMVRNPMSEMQMGTNHYAQNYGVGHRGDFVASPSPGAGSAFAGSSGPNMDYTLAAAYDPAQAMFDFNQYTIAT